MSADRMSPLDATFLHAEDRVSHMHIGSVGILEGPPPAHDDLLAMVEGKLHLIPRYRQIVRFVPFQLGRPVWVDDPEFDIAYHIRRTALPEGGGDDQLRNLVGRVMAQQLDRTKPLWEIWLVENLENDRWALLSKVHHCMVDGVSGAELLSVVLDIFEEPPPTPEPPPWIPQPSPSSVGLATEAVVDLVRSPYEQVRAIRASLRVPRRAAHAAVEVAKGLASVATVAVPPPQSSLNGTIGPNRRYDWTETSVADIKKVRRGLGGTFNDVVLAAIAGGFRRLLIERAEPVDRVIRSLVPVSVRPRDESGRAVGDGTQDNQVAAMFAELPVEVADPVDRLRLVSAQMADLKESNQAVAAEALVSVSAFAPPMLLALGLRAATKAPQRAVNTVTTNVPGPQLPLYVLGRKLLHAYPYVPVAGHIRIGVAIFSYDGKVSFGITGDYDSTPDLHEMVAGIEASMEEMLDAAAAAELATADPRRRGEGVAGRRNGRGDEGEGEGRRPKAKAKPSAAADPEPVGARRKRSPVRTDLADGSPSSPKRRTTSGRRSNGGGSDRQPALGQRTTPGLHLLRPPAPDPTEDVWFGYPAVACGGAGDRRRGEGVRHGRADQRRRLPAAEPGRAGAGGAAGHR